MLWSHGAAILTGFMGRFLGMGGACEELRRLLRLLRDRLDVDELVVPVTGFARPLAEQILERGNKLEPVELPPNEKIENIEDRWGGDASFRVGVATGLVVGEICLERSSSLMSGRGVGALPPRIRISSRRFSTCSRKFGGVWGISTATGVSLLSNR